MRVAVDARAMRGLVRWAQYFFLAAGIGSLGYCLSVLGNGWLYQQSQSRGFDFAIRNNSATAVHAEPETGALLGRLQIPRLGMAVMVVEGVDEDDLARAAGHVPGTTLPDKHGNVGIAGHRDTFFRPLHNIRRNDKIQLTTLHGDYKYRVISTKIVDPGDVQVLAPTRHDMLTLVTCYPFNFIGAAPKRFIVTAARSTG
jgi:sortase A